MELEIAVNVSAKKEPSSTETAFDDSDETEKTLSTSKKGALSIPEDISPTDDKSPDTEQILDAQNDGLQPFIQEDLSDIMTCLEDMRSEISQLKQNTVETKLEFVERIAAVETHLKLQNDIEENNKESYWNNAAEDPGKTPLVKTRTSHKCALLPLTTKISLLVLCLFNYLDTVTDVVTAVGMFRDRKYVLGSLSVIVLVVVGILVPFTTISYKQRADNPEYFRQKWSWRSILALFTVSSTQYLIWKKFIMDHADMKYDRKCQSYNRKKCRSRKCSNMRHQLIRMYFAVITEKMMENQPQLILQILNSAPDYLSPVGVVNDFWYYSRLLSFLITVISLTRSCTAYEFIRSELKLERFSFSSIGKGWKALYPQTWLLFVVHSTAIASMVLRVIFLMILVNHDFSQEITSGPCFLSTALKVIRSQSKTSCYFETKVAWLLFLYMMANLFCVSMIRMLGLQIVSWRSLKTSLKNIEHVGSRVRYIFVHFVKDWLISMGFYVDYFLLQRNFMWDISSGEPYLTYARSIKFTLQILPSLLQAATTGTFTAIFYTMPMRGKQFKNTNLGITPLHLALAGLGIEVLHSVSLVVMAYRAGPQHRKSLSDEKILEVLIRMNKIDSAIDITCSKDAKEIITEAIDKDAGFDVYREDIRKHLMLMAEKCDGIIQTGSLSNWILGNA